MEEEVAKRLSKTAYLSTSLPWVGGACEGTPVCCCSVPGAVAGGNWYLPCEPRWDLEEAGGGGRKGVAPKGSAGLCWKNNKILDFLVDTVKHCKLKPCKAYREL